MAGAAVFEFFGNATRGYIDTGSTVWWWARQWLNPRAETEHGWLILAISAWLFWRNLKAAPRELADRGPSRSECRTPLFAMLGGLALNVVGFVAQQTRLEIVALLLFAWGAVGLADRRWARAAAFPLGFMVFAIPINALDTAGFWLRLWVVDSATSLAHAVGIGVVRSGTQLFAPDGHYQYDVAAACSGVRSLMALLALSLLIGYLNFRATWCRGLMLALCLPLTFLGNLARIFAIVVAAQAGGQAWGQHAHDIMGFGVFVIVVGGILAASSLLRRRFPETPDRVHLISENGPVTTSTDFHVLRESGVAASAPRYATVMAVAVVVLAVGEMVFLARVATAPASGTTGLRLAADERNPVELPAFLGTDWIGRAAEVTAVEREILPPDTGFSRRDYVSLADPAHRVFLSIVLSGRDRTSIHRPELCLEGQGWTLVSAGSHTFTYPGRPGRLIPATLLHTRRTEPRTGRRIEAVVVYWFVSGDTVVATHWQRIWRDALNRLRGRADRWAYVLMQADAADGDAAALARLQTILDQTLPQFQLVAAHAR